jgi:hypothetical protein
MPNQAFMTAAGAFQAAHKKDKNTIVLKVAGSEDCNHHEATKGEMVSPSHEAIGAFLSPMRIRNPFFRLVRSLSTL